MLTRFFFNNRIGHIKARFKQLALILVLAMGVRILMCRFYCSKWMIWNTIRLGRLSTELLYFSLLVVAISCYMLRRGHKNWKTLLTVVATPLIFFLCFCYINNLLLILVTLGLFLYVVVLDVKLVRELYGDEDYIRADGKLYLESLILEDLGVSVRYLGLFSFVIALLIWLPENDYFLMLPSTVYGPQGYYRYTDYLDAGVSNTDYSDATSRSIVQGEIVYATNMRDLETTTPTNLWEPNKRLLVKLSQDHFGKLSFPERLDALQDLLNIETAYLGCEPIVLGVSDMEYSIGGYFDRENLEIVLNRSWVEYSEDSYKLIGTVLHEVYHYYSYRCVEELDKLEAAGINMDLLFARDIRTWSAEQEDYISGTEAFTDDGFDWKTYYQYNSQALETSADAYSALWQDNYWAYINSID